MEPGGEVKVDSGTREEDTRSIRSREVEGNETQRGKTPGNVHKYGNRPYKKGGRSNSIPVVESLELDLGS